MDIIDLEKSKEPTSEIQKGFFITEIIFFCFGVMGTLFKILHWPGATFFLMLGLGFYALFLVIGGLFYRFWQIKLINIFMWPVCIGILFKMLTWPQFQLMLYIGAVAGLLVAVFCILLYQKQKDFIQINKFISFRIISLTLFCWILSVVSAQAFYVTFINNDPIGASLYKKAADDFGNRKAHEAYQAYQKSLNRPYSLDSANVAK